MPHLTRKKIAIYILSFSSMLIFGPFNSTQALQTSVNKSLGYWSLGILYFTLSAFTLITPTIVQKLGPRISIFCGSLTYVLYVFASIESIPAVLLPASAILGMGGGLYWTAQGEYLTRTTETHSELGFHTGIFFFFFFVSMILANIFGAILVDSGQSIQFIFTILTLVGASGSLGMLSLPKLLKYIPPPIDEQFSLLPDSFGNDIPQDPFSGTVPIDSLNSGFSSSNGELPTSDLDLPPSSFSKLFEESLVVLKHQKMKLMFPIIIYSGVSQTYLYGVWPAQIHNKFWTMIGLVAFATSEMFGSLVLGKISDSFGRYKTLHYSQYCGLLGYIIGIPALFLIQIDHNSPQSRTLFILSSILLGILDSSSNTTIYALLGELFPNLTSGAFAVFRMVQSLLSAIVFFVGVALIDLPIVMLIGMATTLVYAFFGLLRLQKVIESGENSFSPFENQLPNSDGTSSHQIVVDLDVGSSNRDPTL